MKYLLVLVYVCFVTEDVTSLFCHWNTGCPYKYFSSKTPYNVVRGDLRDNVIKIQGCETISVWGLYRHGKRYPGPKYGKYIKEAVNIRDYIVSSYAKKNSSLCAQDIENLRDWPIDRNMFEKVNELTDEGHHESLGLGKRLKQTFPTLLTNMEKGSYSFSAARGKGILESAKGFIKGLGNEKLIDVEDNPNYEILEPYSSCEKYRNAGESSELHDQEIKYFYSTEYLVTKDRIQRRSGVNFALTDENITALYDLCRYTWSGIDNKVSPWCAIFTSEDLKTLEYMEDLRNYYKQGYGLENSDKFGRYPLTDLLKNMQLAKDGRGRKINAYFTQSATLDMVYTTLGLFKDETPLTGAHRDPNRKWRSSKLSTFAANFLAVLNRCSIDGSTEYNVVFYLNEEPLRSLCEDGICTWQEFEYKMKPFLNASLDFCDSRISPKI